MPRKIKFILNSPRNPKNIGASARGMANFGFRDLIVVNPYELAWRETRSAVAASDVVLKAKKITSLKAALRGVHLVIGSSAGSRRNTSTRWIGLEQMQDLVRANQTAKKSTALVFGSERSGLSNEDLALCHYVLKLPTVKECPSMNLSQAVAVVACALRDGKNLSKVSTPTVHVSTKHLEPLIAKGLQAYDAAGLLKGWDEVRSERRLRQALYRWNLTEMDVAMLHGIFGWVLKKVKKG